MISSPFGWTSKTIKIKNMLDRYIATKADCKEIPIHRSDYDILLKAINPSIRHRYENDLRYHGRVLVVR